MKEVVKYEADDGTVFDTAEEAKVHEKLLDIRHNYEFNKLYGKYEGSSVEFEGLIAWFDDNLELASDLLNVAKNNKGL